MKVVVLVRGGLIVWIRGELRVVTKPHGDMRVGDEARSLVFVASEEDS